MPVVKWKNAGCSEPGLQLMTDCSKKVEDKILKHQEEQRLLKGEAANLAPNDPAGLPFHVPTALNDELHPHCIAVAVSHNSGTSFSLHIRSYSNRVRIQLPWFRMYSNGDRISIVQFSNSSQVEESKGFYITSKSRSPHTVSIRIQSFYNLRVSNFELIEHNEANADIVRRAPRHCSIDEFLRSFHRGKAWPFHGLQNSVDHDFI